MNQLNLSDIEIYYIYLHMESMLGLPNDKYPRLIYNKLKPVINEMVYEFERSSKSSFTTEYECQWVKELPSDNSLSAEDYDDYARRK
jgi:hypothetical protein